MFDFDPAEDRPPEGYAPLTGRAPSEQFSGPYYLRQGEGRWSIGFRVKSRHLNSMGVCHGGVIAVFVDVLGTAIKRQQGIAVKTPTVTMSVDYVAPVRLGTWVEAAPELVARTRSLLNIHAFLTANGERVGRANCIYKMSAGFGADGGAVPVNLGA